MPWLVRAYDGYRPRRSACKQVSEDGRSARTQLSTLTHKIKQAQQDRAIKTEVLRGFTGHGCLLESSSTQH